MSDQIFVLNIWDNRECYEDTTLYRTREGAQMALAHYCRDFWRWPDPAPDSDDVTIEQYFTRRADYEGYSLHEQQVGPCIGTS
jgi:hypothetical protein